MNLDNREIRVFISSTFRDMQEDRDYLVKFVFPQLRRLCEARSVTWGEVDLRWGITDEEADEGKVLPRCLEEIHRCRPYFIGLLGQRYGWVPKHEEIPADLLERQRWLKDHLVCSVTELEIIHGVLQEERMHEHAYFYFRDPNYLERLPSGRNLADFESESPEAERKLNRLKQRLRAARDEQVCQLREDYRDPEQLGQWVLEDFTKLIDRLYPEGKRPDPLDHEAALHEAFACSRTDGYVRRQEYFDRLDEHAAGTGEPLAVLGESGSGKSALLANWGLHYREENPNDLVLMHFVGAMPFSADWAAMLRRILGEMRRQLGLDFDIPDEAFALRAAFADALTAVTAKRRLVLVLDGLDQLEDSEGARDLIWLPKAIPDNVRLVTSAVPSRPQEVLNRRGAIILEIQPLRTDERAELVRDCLEQYSKKLPPDQLDRLVSADQTGNPLYLRAVLEELRVYGHHHKIHQRIAHCLAAPDILGLYQKILARYEHDYDNGQRGLVRNAMRYLWAARRGLSEVELRDLLGSEEAPLQHAYWSPLHLAAEWSLVNRSGLIGFAHEQFRDAVEQRYLASKGEKQRAHLDLANYFARPGRPKRTMDELLWQIAKAEAWDRLCQALSDPQFLIKAWNNDPFEVKNYWAALESQSLSAVDAYATILDGPIEDVAAAQVVAHLLDEIGHAPEARQLLQQLIASARDSGDDWQAANSLNHDATVLWESGELKAALEQFKSVEQIARRCGNALMLAQCWGNQALIRRDQGYMKDAMALLQQQEAMCRQWDSLMQRYRTSLDRSGIPLPDDERSFDCWKRQLQRCFCNQASIHTWRGDLRAALSLIRQEEHLCRALDLRDDLYVCLGNQAYIYRQLGEMLDAERIEQERREITSG